jgi:NTP pyrophosphatase (non-canonical NTP hydrolase)
MNSSLDDENQKEEAAELILRVSLLCLNRDIPEAIFKIILKMPFLGFET